MSILLRPAAPASSDARAFARLADEAAHGKFRELLGSRSTGFLESVFTETGHDLSHEHVTMAEEQGAVVGMVNAYSGEEHRRNAATTKRLILRHVGLRLPRVLYVYLIGRPVFAFMDHVEPGDHYVQMLAVDPGWRRRGIGTRLLGAAQEQAGPARRMVLDVATDNTGAIAMYESLGWRIVRTSRRSVGDRRRVHRMAKSVIGSR